MLRSRLLAAALAAGSLLALAAPAADAATARPMPECVERLFYTYIREPEPWSPAECLGEESGTRSERPLPDTGPVLCVVYSAVRNPEYISCI